MKPGMRAQVIIDPSAVAGEFNAFGVVSEEAVRGMAETTLSPVTISARCLLQNFITLHEGAYLDEDVMVEDYCRIGAHTRVGAGTRLVHRAYICDDVAIGKNCRIAGFLCDDVVIEDRCTVMGTLLHCYNQPHRDWWSVTEPAPTVRHDSVIGMTATVVGKIIIKPYSYVTAGSLVTRNVPSWHVALGRNELIHWKDWKGPGLKELFSHWAEMDQGNYV